MTGYRCVTAKKTATGDQPESCFDYGNASPTDTAAGNMDAVEFSRNKYWGYGAGGGPWVAADLEAGIYAWNGGTGSWQNPNSQSLAYPFVTAFASFNAEATDDALQANIVAAGYGR